jgi:sulfur carrier protein
MRVTINGEGQEFAGEPTVEDAVGQLHGEGGPARGIAVALNGEVVPRSHWNEVTLKDSDRVEILRAVGGG